MSKKYWHDPGCTTYESAPCTCESPYPIERAKTPNELLDDYRLLADIGKPLGEEHLKVEDIEDLRDSLPKKFNGGRTDAF